MSGWLDTLGDHLPVLPILLPMLTAAAIMLMAEGNRQLKSAIDVVSALAGLGIAIALLLRVEASGPQVYLAGNWPAPFGIVLVADRLSVLMLVLTSCIGLSSVLFASARWDKAGVHFHALTQLQLMGLAGAFLTGDLFNLFVFFEIMLTASYGLLLHGSGRPRVRSGLHYIAINLGASSLFLVGASMLYGVVGTLNMADLSQRVAEVPPENRPLLHAAAAILGVAFLSKAATWPLNFWLVPAYSAATAPAAGFFAILTKVGVYALLRVWTLLFADVAGPSLGFGGTVLVVAGLLTLALAAIGMLGSQRLEALAGFAVILSAGIVLGAFGFGSSAITAGALYYLLSSTLAASALLLLVDLVERWRNAGSTVLDKAPFLTPDLLEDTEGVNLDDEERRLVGRAIPASTALLGLGFMLCAVLISGLPPLSSFVGKVAMLQGVLALASGAQPLRPTELAFFAVVIGSGLLSLIALSRAGIRCFWAADYRGAPTLRLAEGIPVAALRGACVALTVGAGPVLRYTQQAADALHAPAPYREAVLGKRSVLPPEEKDESERGDGGGEP